MTESGKHDVNFRLICRIPVISIAYSAYNSIFFTYRMNEVFGKNPLPTNDEMWDFYVLSSYNKGQRINYRYSNLIVS